jgi:hypothetical protein
MSNMMESWRGHHQSELIASWGPPQSTASDGAGGTILIYSGYVNQGQFGGYQRTRMFYVNDYGYIYTWIAQGL